MSKPKDILNALSRADKELLNQILAIEQRSLHEASIKSNSSEEKRIIKDITIAIDKAVPDET